MKMNNQFINQKVKNNLFINQNPIQVEVVTDMVMENLNLVKFSFIKLSKQSNSF